MSEPNRGLVLGLEPRWDGWQAYQDIVSFSSNWKSLIIPFNPYPKWLTNHNISPL